jgi:dTMP kinase
MTGRAWFITVEGLEGAGKTSCLRSIQRFLVARGLDPVMTREPGGTPLGEAVRALLLGTDYAGMSPDAETLLMFAARAEHLDKVIRPALTAGRAVVCDRFTDATYAYQGGGRSLGEARIAPLEQWLQQGLQPDLTLFLDVPIDVGLARAGRRSVPDRFERERLEFFERARAVYRARAERLNSRIVTVDASAPAETVEAAVVAALEKAFDERG